MKTILVTGAAGFIGSHTVDRLLASTDSQVIGVDDLSTGTLKNLNTPLQHSRFQFKQADIGEAGRLDELCRQHRPDCIIHLAGLVSVARAETEPGLNYALNIHNTYVVAEAARKNEVRRIVFASSAACYGESTELPLSEHQEATPISMYGTAKLASEKILAGYSSSYGIDTVCLRYFNVFGERQDPNSPYSGVISRFAEAFAARESATLYGDGTQTRDFIAVEDVANANVISATATSIESGVRNVCTGQRRRLLDVLSIFETLYPDAVATRFGPERAGDIRDSCGDPQRARRDLAFSASVSLEEGLRRMIQRTRKALLSA